MALKYGFFNSVSGDRRYTAQDIGDYLRGIIYSGVYPDATSSLEVLAAGGMTVEVQPGRAMLEFKYLENDAAYQIALSAGGTMDRIDAIVAYMDLNERACGITVREGTPAAAPAAPTMRRTDVRYEVMLASVYVAKLTNEITQANITDTRHNTDVCGWVRGAIRQESVSIPIPTASTAGYIPHVTPDGTEYELLPTDTTLSFDGAVADAGAVGRALANLSGNLGGVAIDLLWQNASPTSDFPEQTLSIDLTGYTMLQITFKVEAAGTIYVVHNVEINSKINATSISGIASSGYALLVTRGVTTTDSSIHFATGSKKNTNSNSATQDANSMIPLTIYGIKGVN